MKLQLSLIVLCTLRCVSPSLLTDISDMGDDILKGTKQILDGVISGIPNLLPSAEKIFDLKVRFLAGFPFEIGTDLINFVCSIAISTTSIQPPLTPDVNEMNFVLITKNNRTYFPFTNPDMAWKSLSIKNDTKFVLFVTGWMTTANGSNEAATGMAAPYLCRKDVYFFILDIGDYIDTLYTWSAFNTEKIGQTLGNALAALLKYIELENIHLIGHSLGAQIVGSAARWFTNVTNEKIPRITGLDPANPCFEEGEVLSGLGIGDGLYVDIIHTDPGVLGQKNPIGDADFFPGGQLSVQPGCITVVCSHGRAWQYYAESAYPGNEYGFPSKRCDSLYNFLTKKCVGRWFPMGYAANSNIKGTYYLEVNPQSPFGKNSTKSLLNCQ